MFAIVINEANMDKILATPNLTNMAKKALDFYKLTKGEHVFISGYVTPRGSLLQWMILPMFRIREAYQYNPEKIQTDWDQILRKEL